MRRYIFVLVFLLFIFLVGCSSSNANNANNHEKAQNKPQIEDSQESDMEVTEHKIYPDAVMSALNTLKYFKVGSALVVNDKTFIIVSFGEKKGTGYNAKITSIEEKKDKLIVRAEPGKPSSSSTNGVSFDYAVEVVDEKFNNVDFIVKDDYLPKIYGWKGNFSNLVFRDNNIVIFDYGTDPNGIHVEGIARIWEAAFFWEMQDEKGKVIKDGAVMAKAGAPDWGAFYLDIYEKSRSDFLKDVAKLVFLEENAKTGEYEEILSIEVN